MASAAIEKFIGIAEQVISELENAIARGDNAYINADIALKNVRSWYHHAKAGTLPEAYHPNFGISKSDLMFGPVEQRMYELESLFVKDIRATKSAP